MSDEVAGEVVNLSAPIETREARLAVEPEFIESENRFRVDSSPTEVVIRIQPVGAITRKDALLLAAHLAVHANRVDDGSTSADLDDCLNAVIRGTRMPVTRDARDALELRELRAKCVELETKLANLTTLPEGPHEDTPEERRLRGELQASLERETKMELALKEEREAFQRNLGDRAREIATLRAEVESKSATIATLRQDVEAYASGAREP